MGLKILLFLFGLFTLCGTVDASWTGPSEEVSGTWGGEPGQFAIDYQDTQDVFPTTIAASLGGQIAISEDQTLKRIQTFKEGKFERVINTFAFDVVFLNSDLYVSGGGFRKYDSTGRLVWSKPEISFVALYTTVDGNVIGYHRKESKYYLYSPAGQLIKTSTTRPLELGVAEGGSATSGGYSQRVKYPDKTFSFVIPWKTLKLYQQDNAGNLIVTAWTDAKDAVYKISACGKILGQLQMPEDKGHVVQQAGPEPIGELDYEYGPPVIAPNGDVYTWKRTPDTYSILKWTWVDDPNVPTGPDAPTGLSVMPSTTGLYLTWTASPQDPGCVTGYEVSRATSAGGIGTTIATVNAGVVKYNDTSASAGTTYYYKVRAMAGSEYSPYTAETSGKR